jgi:hypothetical protein
VNLFSGDYNFSSLLFSCDYNLQFTNTVHYQLLGIRREVNSIQAQVNEAICSGKIPPAVLIPLKNLADHITEMLDGCVEVIMTQTVGALVDVAGPLVSGHQEFNTQHNQWMGASASLPGTQFPPNFLNLELMSNLPLQDVNLSVQGPSSGIALCDPTYILLWSMSLTDGGCAFNSNALVKFQLISNITGNTQFGQGFIGNVHDPSTSAQAGAPKDDLPLQDVNLSIQGPSSGITLCGPTYILLWSISLTDRGCAFNSNALVNFQLISNITGNTQFGQGFIGNVQDPSTSAQAGAPEDEADPYEYLLFFNQPPEDGPAQDWCVLVSPFLLQPSYPRCLLYVRCMHIQVLFSCY